MGTDKKKCKEMPTVTKAEAELVDRKMRFAFQKNEAK
jgi:hypothetical protein